MHRERVLTIDSYACECHHRWLTQNIWTKSVIPQEIPCFHCHSQLKTKLGKPYFHNQTQPNSECNLITTQLNERQPKKITKVIDKKEKNGRQQKKTIKNGRRPD